MKLIKHTVLLLIIITISYTNITLAEGLSAESIGLADQHSTLTGIDAIYSNPAAVNAEHNLFTLEANAGANIRNNLFMNDFITEDKKDYMLSRIQEHGMLISTAGNVGGKLKIGPVTIFADGKEEALVSLSPDMAELVLKGNQVEKEYDFAGTGGAGAVFADSGINLSFNTPEEFSENIGLNSLSVGFTYHYIMGTMLKAYGNGDITVGYDEGNLPQISGNDGNIILQYSNDNLDTGELARGQAFDIGVYSDINNKYSMGFSLLNIAGNLTAKKITEYKYVLDYDEENNTWQLIKENEGVELNQTTIYKLPLIMKIGGKIKYNYGIDILGNYTRTSYNDNIYDTKLIDNKFALGLEVRTLKYLPFRLGVNYSTLQNDIDVTTGMGIHLGPIKADVGISDLTGLFYKSRGIEGGLNIKIAF